MIYGIPGIKRNTKDSPIASILNRQRSPEEYKRLDQEEHIYGEWNVKV